MSARTPARNHDPRHLPGTKSVRGVLGAENYTAVTALTCMFVGAPRGIRTPNLLIRSQMLYPLS
jgi:hypothetical protein